MKAFRSIFGLLMIGALLALMFHQHDCDADSHEQCPATAWHAGAVQAAALPVTVPTAPQLVIAVVQPSVAPLSETRPHSFLPRGPPVASSI
ncbi:MAG: hypothetical protein HZA91_11335 [Verrucomicrobia bacterium]|nr:hypothetical protein [Verrucomicrobiota bacterium]